MLAVTFAAHQPTTQTSEVLCPLDQYIPLAALENVAVQLEEGFGRSSMMPGWVHLLGIQIIVSVDYPPSQSKTQNKFC